MSQVSTVHLATTVIIFIVHVASEVKSVAVTAQDVTVHDLKTSTYARFRGLSLLLL